MKIKKGDTVIVIAGKDRGKEGVVLRAFPKKLEVLVEGVNVVHRHQKSNQRGSQGQILEKTMPLTISNVALKDSKTGKPVRVGYATEGEEGKKKKIRVTRPLGTKV